METNYITQKFSTNKKPYRKPEILHELLLETKAGSVITPLSNDGVAPIVIMPGGFSSTNDEP